MMHDDGLCFVIGSVVGIIAGAMLMSWLKTDELNLYRAKAVSGGIARYEVNIKDGSTEFRWNDQKVPLMREEEREKRGYGGPGL